MDEQLVGHPDARPDRTEAACHPFHPNPNPTPHQAHPDGEGGEAATRAAAAGRTAEMTFIPPMIAVGAVHHHLIQVGLRMDTSIIAETAQACNPKPNPRPNPDPSPKPLAPRP